MPYADLTPKDIERFWSTVDRLDADGCWLWRGPLKNGYGLFTVFRNGKSKTLLAHRISLEMKIGSLDGPRVLACHTCDVRKCVNPNHLFPGSHQDNARDMVAKGRNGKKGGRPKGSKNRVK